MTRLGRAMVGQWLPSRTEQGGSDLRVRVGSLTLPAPVFTASGTSGHGSELGSYFDLSRLGAVVVKSLSADPWPGNPPPRLWGMEAGMLNSVGLQNPGVEAWLDRYLPPLVATGARVVASIWGFSVGAYERAAALLADAPNAVVAVEVNVSCPNVEDRRRIFAHSSSATSDVVAAARVARRPLWVKLSPNVTDLVEIAGAALDAGADSLTLVNTVMGAALDPVSRRWRLGAGGGGLSGPAVRAVTVRAVSECRREFPEAAIVGVGGVARGTDAAELLAAGANAVQVGTASFVDPRAPARVLDELARWCRDQRVARMADLTGSAHR